MAESGRGIGLAVLLGGFFAVASGGGIALSTRASAGPHQDATAKKGAPGADKTAETPKPRPGKDVYSFLERFAGTAGAPDPASQESSNDGQARTTRALRRLADLGYSKVRTLVATVPDPEDSRFANVFDDAISAMRIAIERSGFIDDRFSDPWRARVGGGEGERPSRRDQPGVLLFRRPNDGTLLIVLLVGETPARGIHRRAFEAALDLSAAVLAAQPVLPPLLPLLGPTLSGTSESIRMTLLRWFEQRRDGLRGAPEGETQPPFDLEIISGSASSDDNQKTLRDDLTRQVRALYPSATRKFASTFQATVHPSSVQERFVVDYLLERGRCRIGLLTESSTGYGTQFADVVGRKDKRVCRDATPIRLIDLPFPLHISKLRSEYDRSQPDGADEKPSAAQKRFRPLEREDDADIDEDAFPAKSRVTQSISEIALEQTLRAIATEDVHAIVIVASSTADVLFLVQKVRQSFPNVTIVLNDAALMYLHEDVPFMEGVLVASTYPLLPWSQRLTFPFEGDQIRLLFSSTAAQGAYNALLMLLDDVTQVNFLDYGGPFTVPTGDFRPWLWMTVVSRGEFWPVWSARGAPQSYLQIAEPRGDALKRTDEGIQATIWTVPGSYVFRVAAFLIAFVDLLLAYAYARGLLTRHRHRKRPIGPLTGLFVPPRDGFQHLRMYRFEITGLLFIAFLVSAGFLAVEVVTVLPMNASLGRFEVPLTVAFGLVTAGMLSLTFHALFRWIGSITSRARARERVAVPFAILSALAASLVIYLLCASRIEVLRSGGTAGAGVAHLMFFIERARNLDGGVSLLWTVLLLGIAHALWILGHIRQVRITEDAEDLRRYGVIPAHHDPGVTTTDGSWLESLDLARPMVAVVREAEGVWPTKFAMLLMLIVMTDAMWISSGLATLEPRRWGLACAFAYGLLLALSVYGCTRYLRAWRALAEVLAKVAPRSVTSALGRIPAELLTSFRRPWDRQVFEVWQHHCRTVFDRIRNEPGLLPRSSAALGVSKEDLLDLLRAPVPVQLEEAERSSAPGPVAATGPAAVPATLSGEQFGPLWEEFLAMRLVAFIQYIRTHLSNLVAVSTAALLPAFWATNFYPLKENRFLLMLVLVVAGATTSVAALVFVQMNRNYVLSKMSHTSPGRVTWDRTFTTRLLIHVALPLLAVLAVKFPELGRAWTTVMSALALSR